MNNSRILIDTKRIWATLKVTFPKTIFSKTAYQYFIVLQQRIDEEGIYIYLVQINI